MANNWSTLLLIVLMAFDVVDGLWTSEAGRRSEVGEGSGKGLYSLQLGRSYLFILVPFVKSALANGGKGSKGGENVESVVN